MNDNTLPRHLRSRACYVCGGTGENCGSHDYWANEDAEAYFNSLPVVDVTYSDGTHSPETHFVNQTRGI